MAEKRGRGNPNWKKGVSGNPGGRRSNAPLTEYVRKKFGKDGKKLVDALGAILTNDKASAGDKIRAVALLFERGWGKAPIEVDVDGNVGISGEGLPIHFTLGETETGVLAQIALGQFKKPEGGDE